MNRCGKETAKSALDLLLLTRDPLLGIFAFWFVLSALAPTGHPIPMPPYASPPLFWRSSLNLLYAIGSVGGAKSSWLASPKLMPEVIRMAYCSLVKQECPAADEPMARCTKCGCICPEECLALGYGVCEVCLSGG